MKLLLDEMYDPEIALLLVNKGHDVEAISGSSRAGLSDNQVLAHALATERCLLTNNVRDFMPIHQQWLQSGQNHYGIAFTDDKRMSRAKNGIGFFVKTLDAFLNARPSLTELQDNIAWVP